MLGRVIRVLDNLIYVKLDIDIYNQDNLINKYVVFEGNNILAGEVINIDDNTLIISLLGEFVNNDFIYGNVNKPSFNSKVRLMNNEDLKTLYKNSFVNSINVGKSVFNDFDIELDINNLFSNHFAILGNSGSGKSYALSRIVQQTFYSAKTLPYYPNILIFDAFGEYQNVFNNISSINENINYKVITTDLKSNDMEILKIPFWLLGVDDLALLLNVTEPSQIPIIEKALKLVGYFVRDDETVIQQKTDIIARNVLDIIFNGKSPSEIRNKIISILSKFNTDKINLEYPLVKGGWTRTLRQCISIEADGKFADIEGVIAHLESLINNVFELTLPDGTFMYTLEDFATALEFALISEGILNSNKVFDYANILKIRLNSLINSDYSRYFIFDQFITNVDYLRYLLSNNQGKKVQVLNFNINYVDDRFAKTLVKIFSKFIFDYATRLERRGSVPFHIVLEEAHRYVQNDNDINTIGYNIFDRIAKEGRKYGVLLGLISQRPNELSQTTISQCSNFFIFKIFNPLDLDFIKAIVPNIDNQLINRIKLFYPGICLINGNSVKFPTVVQLEKPNPEPMSQNVDINNTWYVKNN